MFLDDSEAYDRIYCSYDFIKKIEDNGHYTVKGIYIFENDIHEIIDDTVSKYEYIENDRLGYMSFYKTLEMYFGINIVIFSLVLVIVIFEKNHRLTDIYEISRIYYCREYKLIFKNYLYDLIIQVLSFVLATILVCLCIIIFNILFKQLIYPDLIYYNSFILIILITTFVHIILNLYRILMR